MDQNSLLSTSHPGGPTYFAHLFCFGNEDHLKRKKWLFTVKLEERRERKCEACPHLPLMKIREREKERQREGKKKRETQLHFTWC